MKKYLNVRKYPKLKDFKRIFDQRVDQEYSGIYCNLKLEKSSFIEFIAQHWAKQMS